MYNKKINLVLFIKIAYPKTRVIGITVKLPLIIVVNIFTVTELEILNSNYFS